MGCALVQVIRATACTSVLVLNSWGQRWRRVVLLCSDQGNSMYVSAGAEQLGSEVA